jgi:hypothetical protein
MQDVNRQLIEPLQQFDLTQNKVAQDLLKQLVPAVQSYGDVTQRTFADLRLTFDDFKREATDAFNMVSDATVRAAISAAIHGQKIDKALAQAAKSTLAHLAEQAGQQALYAFAQGLWFLAQAIFFDDPAAAAAAATDFEAAAEWAQSPESQEQQRLLCARRQRGRRPTQVRATALEAATGSVAMAEAAVPSSVAMAWLRAPPAR